MKRAKQLFYRLRNRLKLIRLRHLYYLVSLGIIVASSYLYYIQIKENESIIQNNLISADKAKTEYENLANELEELKTQDQYLINQELTASISATKEAFNSASDMFESWADIREQGLEVEDIEIKIAKVLRNLADLNYQEASSQAERIISEINDVISQEEAKQVAQIAVQPESTSNELPGSGHSVQVVSSERGNYRVSMIVAPGATVVVDTAIEEDCLDNCATLSLADYVSRNGGFAGINGGYFCPPDYASCQGKTNSFDTLVFNGRIKKAFNQSNNQYSVVPLMAAYGSSLNFYSRTLEWGVDGAASGAVANYPLLLSGGNISFDEGSIPSYLKDNKGTRGFIGTKGGSVVIGHVFGATVPEAGYALKALGLEYALNLDGGGSSALWYGGYKVGPGRSLPVAIVLK